MKVYGLWYGGPNYSDPDVERDVQEFSSIKEAKEIFIRLYENNPCVKNPEMDLFFADPRNMQDPYPNRVLKIGKRGGVVMEEA
jgi:hypothetical protein